MPGFDESRRVTVKGSFGALNFEGSFVTYGSVLAVLLGYLYILSYCSQCNERMARHIARELRDLYLVVPMTLFLSRPARQTTSAAAAASFVGTFCLASLANVAFTIPDRISHA